MRDQLIEELEHLSDSEYQKRIWINEQFDPQTYYDSLDEAIHYFFDDTELAEDARSCIGSILISDREAVAITELLQVFGSLIERLGDVSAASYIDSQEWQQILQLASDAKEIVASHADV